MAIEFKRLVYQDAIPTKTSQLTNDSNFLTDIPNEYITESELNNKGYLTEHQDISGKADKSELFSKNYNDLTNKPTIPTNVSQLTNDSSFITKAVNNLTNYYKKTETYSQTEINNLISSIPKFDIQVVTSLPTSNISTSTIYLKTITEETSNLYEEYIYVNNKWEKLGSQTVDLTGYAKEESIPTKTSQLTNDSGYLTSVPDTYAKKTDIITNNNQLTNGAGYITSSALSSYAKTSAIPTKTSQLTNDSDFTTKSEVATAIANTQIEMVLKDTVEEGFAWLEENGNKERKYCLADGFVYAYTTKEVTVEKPNCNNLFTNTNLLKGWRISSSNAFKSDGTETTVTQDFIPVNAGQTYTIRGYNCGGIANIIEYSDIPAPFVLGQVPSTFVAKSDGNNEKAWEDPKGAVHRFTHTMNSATKFISFVLYTIDDTELSSVIITLDEPVVLGSTTVTETQTGWFNTRQTFNSQVSEERVIALEDNVATLMNAAGGDVLTLPDYWKDHMDARVKAIREKMAEVGRNRSAFFFYSDAHWTDNARKSPMLLKYLYKYTPINKTNFGGDIVLTENYDYATMSYLFDSWRSSIRDLPNHHSVAGNHDDRNEKGHDHEFTIENVYSFLLAPEECNDRVDGEGLYYYIDDKIEKTRYIYLDTACYGGAYLSSEQTQFLVNSLTSTPSNYHIIIIAHAWFSQNYDNFPTVTADGLTSTTTKIVEIANNYNTRAKGNLSGLYVESSQSYSGTVNFDFSSSTGKVEFCLGGHLHNDHSKMFSGIPVIIVEADTIHNRNGSVAKVGTVSEQSISAVIADYKNNEVNFIRVGRGDSYKINLSTGEKTIITIDDIAKPKNLLDDAGYETGVRLNSSGTTTPRDTNDRWVTGFIPVTTGDTLYFKNIEMLNDDYGNIVAHYFEDQSPKTGGSYSMSAASSAITYADDGTTIASYKMTLTDIKWVRFCFVKVDENSIITKNQPID